MSCSVASERFSKQPLCGMVTGDVAITGSGARLHTVTGKQGKPGTIDLKALVAREEEFLRRLLRTALQEVLELPTRSA
jgi:hypothetical protein